jgi:hypothetical protein
VLGLHDSSLMLASGAFMIESSYRAVAYQRPTKLFHLPFNSLSSSSSKLICFCMSRYDWKSGLYSLNWRFDSCCALYGSDTVSGAGERLRCLCFLRRSSSRRGERAGRSRWRSATSRIGDLDRDRFLCPAGSTSASRGIVDVAVGITTTSRRAPLSKLVARVQTPLRANLNLQAPPFHLFPSIRTL